MPSSDGGHGGSFGGDHDGMGHAFASGVVGGGGGPGGGFVYGTVGHEMACMGTTEGAEDGGGIRLSRRARIGVAHNDRAYHLRVFPHGQVDVETVLANMFRKHGFHSVNHRKRGCIPITKYDPVLRDTTPFDGQEGNSPMPMGWYLNATGSTTWYMNFWQLPTKASYFWPAEVDLKEPAHLIVNSYTWYFNEVGDFETRVMMSVTAQRVMKHGLWVERKDLIEKYMTVLACVASDLEHTLPMYKVSVASVVQRETMERAALITARNTTRAAVPAPVVAAETAVVAPRRLIVPVAAPADTVMAFDHV